jgi:hypothetical protein
MDISNEAMPDFVTWEDIGRAWLHTATRMFEGTGDGLEIHVKAPWPAWYALCALSGMMSQAENFTEDDLQECWAFYWARRPQ